MPAPNPSCPAVDSRRTSAASPECATRRRGISLVELPFLLTFVGTLAALATHSVRERLHEAYAVEAVTTLGAIRAGILAREDRPCGSAEPVPASVEAITAKVYVSNPADWQQGSREKGWPCLSVRGGSSQRYQYGYELGDSASSLDAAPGEAETTLTAWARGDLDGDGHTSWFVLSGVMQGGRAVVAPAVSIIDADE